MNNNKNENKFDDIITKLISELSKLKDINNNELPIPHDIDEDIEVNAAEGTPIKIDSRVYYKTIYAEVFNLKKDTESLIQVYLDDVKPTLKSVDDNVKALSEKLVRITNDVENLKKNRPKKFKEWLAEKGTIAENFGKVAKFVFYIILFIWLISVGIPNTVVLIGKIISHL